MTSYVFAGRLMHSRRTPIKNNFTYPVFSLLLDVDELPALDRRLALFGYNRPNLVSVRSQDHLGDPKAGIRANLDAYLAERGVSLPGGKIYMLTNPRIAGYGFNPVSFFYCYDAEGALACIVAEVNNTHGGQHPYLLSPDCALPATDRALPATDRALPSTDRALPSPARAPVYRYWADKVFYVSPFIDMDARYEFSFSPLADAMHVQIDEFRDGVKFFQARLWGQRQPLTNRSLLAHLLRYPFMTLQVFALIHWQAIKLKRLGAPWFDPQPAPPPA